MRVGMGYLRYGMRASVLLWDENMDVSYRVYDVSYEDKESMISYKVVGTERTLPFYFHMNSIHALVYAIHH